MGSQLEFSVKIPDSPGKFVTVGVYTDIVTAYHHAEEVKGIVFARVLGPWTDPDNARNHAQVLDRYRQ